MHSLESLFAQIVLFLKVLSVIVVPFLIHIYLIKWKGLAIRYKYTYTSRLFSEGSFVAVGLYLPLTMISVSVEIYPEGLWLRHYRPYSILLPEILVPWEKIKLIRSQNSLFGKVHVFAIEAYAGSIKIKGAAGKAIADKVAHA